MPDETVPVETGQPAEFKAPEGHRLVTEAQWSELDNKAKQFDELSPKATRWQEQVRGSQKLIESIKGAGFDTVDSALSYLSTAAKMHKLGANPERLAQAFEVEQEQKPTGFDPDALKSTIRSVLDEVEQQKTAQSREKAMAADFARIEKLTGELSGENATDWDKVAIGEALKGRYIESIVNGDTPGEALDRVVEGIKKIRETATAQQTGKELASIAETAKQARPVKTPTTGGMGKPTETTTSKRKLFSDEDTDAAAEKLIQGLRGR